jgi:hypothetical protein
MRKINRMVNKLKSDLNLVALDNYIEGADDSPHRADKFALSAPSVAILTIRVFFENGEIINNLNRPARADALAQPAACTLIIIYYWYHWLSLSLLLL